MTMTLTLTRTTDPDSLLDAGETGELRQAVQPSGLLRGGRIGALDALRGVAALVVVAEHGMLTNRTLWGFELQHRAPHGWSVATVMMFTPLHILWSGGVAVFIFFILSGLVLARPWVSASRSGLGSPAVAPWRSYYTKRLIRIYVPIVASVMVAYTIVLIFPRYVVPGASGWLNDHALFTHLSTSWHEIFAVAKPDDLNSSLWSLKWEVIFSACLPLYLFVGRRLRGWWVAKIAVCLALVLWGWQIENQALEYLPIFAIGTVMAFQADQFTTWGRRVAARGSRMMFPGLAILCVVLLTIESSTLGLAERIGGESGSLFLHSMRVLSIVGGALAVFLCLAWPRAEKVGDCRALRWLGSRSFSIYLLNDPVLVTIALLLGGLANPALLLLVAVPVLLVMAEGFHRLVDSRSIDLGRRVAALIGGGASGQPARIGETRGEALVGRST
jgi:peptidoglycan/LPS O-acetylase OafA/YrhL